MMNYEIYSIECYKNFFCYTGYDYYNDNYYQFSIGCSYNDSHKLHAHLCSGITQIGFNNLCVFYPVLHAFMQRYSFYRSANPDYIAYSLKEEIERVMEMDNYFIADSDKYVKQIDLFRILHYNNKSLSTSLADIKFHLGMNIIPKPNLDTVMPSNTYDILLHSTNNVQAITGLFKAVTGDNKLFPKYYGANIIKARYYIKNTLGIPCINYSDSRLGEQIVLKTYCNEKDLNYKDIKDLRTNRYSIDYKDCIPDIKFVTNRFDKLIEYYSNYIMTDFEKKPEYKVIINNIMLTFGNGGIHSFTKSGKYISDDSYEYLDLDISSYYPSVICKLGIYPAHFDSDFVDIYKKNILDKRFDELDNNGDLAMINILKKASNSCFGKMGDSDSPLFDYLAFCRIVVGAQMYTALFIDMLSNKFDIEFVFVNTDGMCIKIHKEDHDDIIEYCKSIMNEWGFRLKINSVNRLFLKDVNNYVMDCNGKISTKGIFEYSKEFHKDPSALIIPIALCRYFIKDEPFEDTIRNWPRINEFCIRLKVRSNTKYKYNNEELHKTNRYYVSVQNNVITKFNQFNYEPINNFHHTLLNKITSPYSKDYAIDYRYYIQECRKIIDSIIVRQLELF